MHIEEHNHAEECHCGHEHKESHDGCHCHHEHAHTHHDACQCGHEHDNTVRDTSFADSGLPVTIYIIEHLGCANCAAKMEHKINELPDVESATITFATKQLRVVSSNPEALLPVMERICQSIEPEVTLTVKTETIKKHTDSDSSESRKALICILIGATLFLLAKPASLLHPAFSFTLYLIAYLILGLEIVLTAVRNIGKGNFFDENFLMSIATIGAFLIKEPGGSFGAYAPEAVGVMLFYRIGEWFEHRAVAKSRSQIMDALDLRPETVQMVTGDATREIPSENATVGDIVLVRPGDRIPLDGIIIEGESRLDTSPITGEPVPVSVSCGSAIFSGCMNLSGVLKLKVEKPLSESMVTRILTSVENAAASKPKIDKFITRFSKVYTPFVVALALFTAIVPSLFTGDWEHWIYTALTFLVISCPCALVLSVPLAFFAGIGAGSKKGILFKGGAALEALNSIKAVVMDKTGTVTKGNFTVQKIVTAPDVALSEDALLSLAATCEASSSHPIAHSICEAAAQKGLPFTTNGSVTEIPGHGICLIQNDTTYLCGNTKLLTKYHVDTSAHAPSSYGTEVLLAKDGTYIGCLVIADMIKDDAKEAIAALKKKGLITAMLTGDAMESATAVARETGIDEIHAQLLPQEKLTHLEEIRVQYGNVMFVGDGINDAPVLAGADVGAAMGSGADAAIEAADVVFMTSEMQAIPSAIKIAHTTNRISKQNVIFAIAVKVLFMILGLCGISSMWLAVFADTGVAMLCILNSVRILYKK